MTKLRHIQCTKSEVKGNSSFLEIQHMMLLSEMFLRRSGVGTPESAQANRKGMCSMYIKVQSGGPLLYF